MIEIIPAMMPTTFHELREKAESVVGLVRTVQLDVMDGRFVPEKSWPYSEDVALLPALIASDQGLPAWEELDYEIDLMVVDPFAIIPGFVGACASRVIVHYESLNDPSTALAALLRYREEVYDSGALAKPLSLGVAIGTETPVEAIYEWIPHIDVVQCMGIARIGYQRQPFDERVIRSVAHIRAASPEVIISVDGGVTPETAPLLVEAGANLLVSGSYIFDAPDISEAIETLHAAVVQG